MHLACCKDYTNLVELCLQLVDEPKFDLSFSVPSGKLAQPFRGGVTYATDILDEATVGNMVDMLQVRAWRSNQAFAFNRKTLVFRAMQTMALYFIQA